jgi:Zn-dependent protease
MRCEKCQQETFLPFRCPHCGGRFCTAHRLPESHDCPKTEPASATKEAVVIQKPTSYEYEVTFGPSRRSEGLIYFSPKELKHLAIAALLVIFIGLMSGVYSSIFPRTNLPVSIAAFTIILTASFFMHEIAHKVTAQKRGLWAEFRLTRWGAIVTLISAISPLFKIISPGAVMISGSVGRKEMAKISIAGPITNIALATALLGAAFAPSPFSLVFFYGAFFNAFIALFNLIPIGVLDGLKIFVWNTKIWACVFASSLTLVIATYLFLS